MCQSVLYLAEHAGHRYISQCEHGTVHLVWDAVGLHVPADAFCHLATNILRTANDLVAKNEQRLHGHCRLQVGDIAVELPLADFLLMATLVEEALPAVNLADGRVRHAAPTIAFPYRQHPPMLN